MVDVRLVWPGIVLGESHEVTGRRPGQRRRWAMVGSVLKMFSHRSPFALHLQSVQAVLRSMASLRASRLLQLLVATAVVGFASPIAAQTLRDPTLQSTLIASGLSLPTGLAFIGPDDILVTQKDDGKVRRIVGGVLQPNDVLDVGVDTVSERGLLGIALHPAFPTTPFVYLYYTESSTGGSGDTAGSPPGPLGNQVYRYFWTGSALINPVQILNLPVTPGPNHDGGRILFGPDGKLYVVIGDLNRNGQLQNNAAGPGPDDTGVILRLNDDGSIPADNPFVPFVLSGGDPLLAKYFAYGIRNSFGMAFDPRTNRLWMTENGPETYDEINLVLPGFNSGWNPLRGPSARDPQNLANLFQVPGSQYRDPSFSWFFPTVGPTGIVFLNSGRLGTRYLNHVFVGDINFGRLYHFAPNPTCDGFKFGDSRLSSDSVADDENELDETILGEGFGGITDLAVAPDGRLYVLSFFQGSIYAVSQRESQPRLSASPGTVSPGAAITAMWGGIETPSPKDWIGLYRPGEPSTAYIDWIYTNCTKGARSSGTSDGSCPLLLQQNFPSGRYELRLFANDGFDPLLAASRSFTVIPGATLSASPSAVPAGSPVTVTWGGNGAASPRDWIGLYKSCAAPTAYLGWAYTSCTMTPTSPSPAGSCRLTVPATQSPGPYEVRSLANDGFETTFATSESFTVTPPGPSVSASPVAVSAGDTVTATWNNIPAPSPRDWIGLFTLNAPATDYIDWVYVSCTKTPGAAQATGLCSFTLPAGLAAGTYELRLLGNDGFDRLAASNRFTITSAP
ncbi:MAG: PQQ-dependent sugar dehydrogenase [Burkholderiales bacterium]